MHVAGEASFFFFLGHACTPLRRCRGVLKTFRLMTAGPIALQKEVEEKKITLSSYFLTLRGEAEEGDKKAIHEDNPFGISVMDEGSCGVTETRGRGRSVSGISDEKKDDGGEDCRREREKDVEEDKENKDATEQEKNTESLDDLMAKMKALQSS